MIFIDDLFDLDYLAEMLATGLVRCQDHPVLPLTIYNYTQKAQFANVWNEVTKQCRGLIVEDSTGRIVARPFPKFFNLGQPGAPELDLDTPVRAFDKMDGSLGILYDYNGNIGIATRGSFTSEQAIQANRMLDRYLELGWLPRPAFTYLFEIIYPENRIVVNYGDLETLVLLEILETDTGLPAYDYEWDCPGQWAFELDDVETLEDALSLPDRENAEGMVLYVPHLNERVKVKQEDYVRLHALITNLSARQLWRGIVDGHTIEDLVAPIPDEFQSWALDVCNNIVGTARATERGVRADLEEIIVENWQSDWTRKDFALYVQDCPYKHLLFALLDGKDIYQTILKSLEPSSDQDFLPRAFSEDTA